MVMPQSLIGASSASWIKCYKVHKQISQKPGLRSSLTSTFGKVKEEAITTKKKKIKLIENLKLVNNRLDHTILQERDLPAAVIFFLNGVHAVVRSEGKPFIARTRKRKRHEGLIGCPVLCFSTAFFEKNKRIIAYQLQIGKEEEKKKHLFTWRP